MLQFTVEDRRGELAGFFGGVGAHCGDAREDKHRDEEEGNEEIVHRWTLFCFEVADKPAFLFWRQILPSLVGSWRVTLLGEVRKSGQGARHPERRPVRFLRRTEWKDPEGDGNATWL